MIFYLIILVTLQYNRVIFDILIIIIVLTLNFTMFNVIVYYF